MMSRTLTSTTAPECKEQVLILVHISGEEPPVGGDNIQG